MDMDSNQFRELIFEAYPRLRNGGGFQFFKCAPNSRNMELLSQVVMTSPQLLKERVGTARTYIRPLQRNLDLSVAFDLPEGV